MAKQLIQVPAEVVGMSPKADKSWKLTFETRELSGPEVTILADNLQAEGWLVYSPNEIEAPDIPKAQADSGNKTQSQRLRDVTYILWKQKGEKGDFEMFYRVTMERLIEFVKGKLEPEEV